MTGPLRVGPRLTVPEDELQWRFSRAGGPGGQGVNTTDSRVQLSWDVTTSRAVDDVQRARLLTALAPRLVDGVLTVTAAEHRAQRRNRQAALVRMATLLGDALAPPPRARRATRPTRGSVERRIAGKRRRSQTKQLRRNDDD